MCIVMYGGGGFFIGLGGQRRQNGLNSQKRLNGQNRLSGGGVLGFL